MKNYLNKRIVSIIFLTFTAYLLIFSIGGQAMDTEHLSMITTPVFLLKGDKIISQGTGFYYVLKGSSQNDILFLITNYHVLTGHSPEEIETPKGDNIIFYFHKNIQNPGDVKEIKYPLFTKNGKSIWLCSKKYPQADIAIIPLVSSIFSDCEIKGISEDWTKGNMRIRPTSSITLIGYPYGYYDKKNWLPVWKTGSIASEPDIDFEGKPLFLVDVSAFPGMSGSPVFAIAYGAYETIEGPTTIGHVQKFLGIYASNEILREKKFLEEINSKSSKLGFIEDKSLELAHIWKASLIINIVKEIDVEKYESEILKNIN